jgi:hypothetical protein
MQGVTINMLLDGKLQNVHLETRDGKAIHAAISTHLEDVVASLVPSPQDGNAAPDAPSSLASAATPRQLASAAPSPSRSLEPINDEDVSAMPPDAVPELSVAQWPVDEEEAGSSGEAAGALDEPEDETGELAEEGVLPQSGGSGGAQPVELAPAAAYALQACRDMASVQSTQATVASAACDSAAVDGVHKLHSRGVAGGSAFDLPHSGGGSASEDSAELAIAASNVAAQGALSAAACERSLVGFRRLSEKWAVGAASEGDKEATEVGLSGEDLELEERVTAEWRAMPAASERCQHRFGAGSGEGETVGEGGEARVHMYSPWQGVTDAAGPDPVTAVVVEDKGEQGLVAFKNGSVRGSALCGRGGGGQAAPPSTNGSTSKVPIELGVGQEEDRDGVSVWAEGSSSEPIDMVEAVGRVPLCTVGGNNGNSSPDAQVPGNSISEPLPAQKVSPKAADGPRKGLPVKPGPLGPKVGQHVKSFEKEMRKVLRTRASSRLAPEDSDDSFM